MPKLPRKLADKPANELVVRAKDSCAQNLAHREGDLRDLTRERDRYRDALSKLYFGDHVGTGINRGSGAMRLIEEALTWTDAEVEQFLKEWGEGKHQLSPADEAALSRSRDELFQRIKHSLKTH